MKYVKEALRGLGELWMSVMRPTGRSLKENTGLAAVSVVLAFGVWLLVVDTQGGDMRRGTLPNSFVPVIPENVPRGLSVVGLKTEGNIGWVQVQVNVDEDVWNELKSDDFKATVDLSSFPEGEHDGLPVLVTTSVSRGRLEVLGAVPSLIKVTLAQTVTNAVPAQVELHGSALPGLEVGEPQLALDTLVTVSGPKERVDAVEKVVAPVDITDAADTITKRVKFEARDEQGLLVTGVDLDPPTVSVSIPIVRRQLAKVLTVSPTLKGTPAEGYSITGISVTPAVVSVAGNREVLETLSVVNTEAVDVGDAKENVTKKVRLEAPSGTSVVGAPDVTVIVRIEALRGQVSLGVTPAAVGISEGLRLGAAPLVTVTLEGPLPLLKTIGPKDLDAKMDLSGLTEGAHTVKISVEPPTGTSLLSVNPSSVQALLTR